MKIGIIGTGNMGRAVGVRLAQLGYDVMFGARRSAQAKSAADAAGQNAQTGTLDEAADFGEVLIWTIRRSDPAHVLGDPSLLDGKIVMDLNNRDYANDVKGGVWFGKAIAEELQAQIPTARVVKALNTIAMESFDTTPDTLLAAGAQTFLAGDDPRAKEIVGRVVRDLGFAPVDIGTGPAAMRAAEAIGDVIRLLMIDGGHGGRAHLSLTRLPVPDLSTIGARQSSNYR